MPPRGPQNARDAEVYKHLVSLVALGRGREKWDAATVVRVAETFLPHPRILRRQLDKAINELEALKAECAELRKRCNHLRARNQHLETLVDASRTVIKPHVGPPLRTVALPRRQYELLEMMTAGLRTRGVSDRLGISYTAASNRIWRLNHTLGVHSQDEAVTGVLSGAIVVKTK